MSANFKVIHIDPEGSGLDYGNHLGMLVTNAKRCCNRCTIIFGEMGCCPDVGPFVIGELEPINDEAKQLLEEVQAYHKTELERAKQKPIEIIKTRQFQKSYAKLTGQVYFDAPTFEIKKGIS